jgi:hypothetical protein
MLLARTFDAVLKVTFTEGKLPDHLVGAFCRVAAEIAASKPDVLASVEHVCHQNTLKWVQPASPTRGRRQCIANDGELRRHRDIPTQSARSGWIYRTRDRVRRRQDCHCVGLAWNRHLCAAASACRLLA